MAAQYNVQVTGWASHRCKEPVYGITSLLIRAGDNDAAEADIINVFANNSVKGEYYV
jgi:hypothetical protein